MEIYLFIIIIFFQLLSREKLFPFFFETAHLFHEVPPPLLCRFSWGGGMDVVLSLRPPPSFVTESLYFWSFFATLQLCRCVASMRLRVDPTLRRVFSELQSEASLPAILRLALC
jgi:hypothetical protein